jgi:hypothetical protein
MARALTTAESQRGRIACAKSRRENERSNQQEPVRGNLEKLHLPNFSAVKRQVCSSELIDFAASLAAWIGSQTKLKVQHMAFRPY